MQPGQEGDLTGLVLTDRGGGVRLSVRVRPRSSRSAVVGVREGALDVALTSAPADGAANAELVELIARAFEVRKRDVTIASGTASRNKLVDVVGVVAAEARLRLGKARS